MSGRRTRRGRDANVSDEELLGQYLRGRTAAFDTLVDRHARSLYDFILRRTGDEQAARDLLQETFLRVVRQGERFRGGSRVTTWLFRIARNLCVDHARRQSHRRHPSLDHPADPAEGNESPALGDRVASAAPAPDRRAADRRFRAAFERALARLPDIQREVFVLRELEGLTFPEIAEVVGAPANTVKSRMRYALDALRGELADYHDR